MKTRILYLFSFYLLAVVTTHAQVRQNDETHFQLLGKIINDKPVVKIIPSHPGAWYLGMHNGYKISISEFKNDTYSPFVVLEDNLKPAGEEEFRNSNLPEKYAESMRKIIYEEDFVPKGKSFDHLAEASEVMRRLFMGYFLFSTYHPDLSSMSGLQFELPADLNSRVHIKIEIPNSDFSHEQIMDVSGFAGVYASPDIEIEQGDKIVKITWNHKKREKQFTAYVIERSSDGYVFESTGTPYIFNENTEEGKLGLMNVTDSLLKNYTTYHYRVRGFDAFGQMSLPGASVAIYGRDLTPPDAPARLQVSQVTENHISLTWSASSAPDLAGFQVIASESEKGTYHRMHENLLHVNARSFEYKFTQAPLRYYRVLAVDTAGNAAASDLGYLVVYDTIPPQTPTNIQAVVDSNHIVTLTWNSSPDSDTKGYRVYKAYHPSHGFIPITPTPVTETVFIDTLSKNRTDKKIFYQVAALDHHFNHSEPSEPIWAAIPDFIPPTAPLLVLAQPDENGNIILEWKPSSSSDVKKYEVMRRLDSDSVYTKIGQTTPSQLHYSDINFQKVPAVFAEYLITAIDSSYNASAASNAKRVLSIASNTLAIQIHSAKVLENGVLITWQNKNTWGNVLIYRADSDGKYQLIDRVSGGDQYIDRTVRPGEKYQYKIGLISETGSRSELSKMVEVEVK